MSSYRWDTLQLTLSTDEAGKGCVRVLFDRDELELGCDLMCMRRFNRTVVDWPKVVVGRCSELEFECEVYYEGEQESGRRCVLHLDQNPGVEIRVGTGERPATIGLYLEIFDVLDPEEESDDDGRYDA